MAKYNFKVGDKVRIREWEDMAKEFGLTKDTRDISCNSYLFKKEMKPLCGKTATIKRLQGSEIVLLCFDDTSIHTKWYYTREMIEPIADEIITIKRKGKEVIAECGDSIGIAKCCPEDTFDFYTGATLALTRLFEEKAKQDTKKTIDKMVENYKKELYAKYNIE